MEYLIRMTKEQYANFEKSGLKYEQVMQPIAAKIWIEDDVVNAIKEGGYLVSPEDIENICNCAELDELNDCTDHDWEIIHTAIRETLS